VAGHAFRHVLARRLSGSRELESLKTLKLSGELGQRREDFCAMPTRLYPGPHFGDSAFRIHQKGITGRDFVTKKTGQ
jgi:hypothetical protein